MKQNNETVLAEETSIESECASVNIIHHTQYANHDERCVILKESKYESVVQIPNGYDNNLPYALSVSFMFFVLNWYVRRYFNSATTTFTALLASILGIELLDGSWI